MESSNFKTNISLSANSQFPFTTGILWDNVLNYTKFYIQILCNLNCKITVYQCNSITPTVDFSDITTLNYNNINQTNIFEGPITSSQISFTLKNNTNQNQSTLYFSVIYK